jgi:uracil-DNA glycosylase
LDQAGIPRERCFFTNAYMGLIDGPKATGKFPGARDPIFVKQCIDFLAAQIQVAQPRVILTLGKEVPLLLAELSPDLKSVWAGAKNLSELDARAVALVPAARFAGLPAPAVVVALTHPSQRPLNIGRRCYKGLHGDEAEQALLKEALALAQIPSDMTHASTP